MAQPIKLESLTASAAATFEEPFEMLEACHERVHRMLKLLGRLREHLRQHGADSQAQQAARDVMRYFDQAAPQHHRDEELHVFPPLLAGSDAETQAIVRRLQADHLKMEAGWAQARQVLEAVVSGAAGPLAPAQEAALDAFAGLYDGHIRAEEEIAYPAAQKLLDGETVAAMGREMMARRGMR